MGLAFLLRSVVGQGCGALLVRSPSHAAPRKRIERTKTGYLVKVYPALRHDPDAKVT